MIVLIISGFNSGPQMGKAESDFSQVRFLSARYDRIERREADAGYLMNQDKPEEVSLTVQEILPLYDFTGKEETHG